MPEPRGNRASRKWNRESSREGARISICPREYVRKSRQIKKQESAWSEDGGKKNKYLTLWEGRFAVMCGVHGKGRCAVLYCHMW